MEIVLAVPAEELEEFNAHIVGLVELWRRMGEVGCEECDHPLYLRGMARYVLDIVDPSKRKLFDQLLKELDFVEVVNIFRSGKKAQVALEVMEAMEDVKAHVAGRKKLKSAKQLLDEL